ncbi:MAG: DUF2087 domain-containing protein [Candidatus Limnocylindrales bacterium]
MDEQLLAGLRALVDQHRLRIVARLVARPTDAPTLAAELRLPLPAIRRHLETLVAAGLVEARADNPGQFAARLDRVGELGRGLSALGAVAAGRPVEPGGDWPHDGASLAETLERLGPTPEESKVLRAFLVDGRLVSIPARGRKRDVILRFLLERVFTEDRDYPEKEVNQRLALFHPDVAALRRYLVDERYLTRAAGQYRRAGDRAAATADQAQPLPARDPEERLPGV